MPADYWDNNPVAYLLAYFLLDVNASDRNVSIKKSKEL